MYRIINNYWLCDLSRYSDEEIKGAVILRVGLLLLKYIWQDDLLERLTEIEDLFRKLALQKTGLEYINTILRYIAGSTDKISQTELKTFVTEVFQEGEALMPTIAEQWIEQGREQGLEQGRDAALKVLRRLLAQRFSVNLDYFDATLNMLDLTAITQLSDVAFEVESLAEFEVRLAKLTTSLSSTSPNEPEETI